MRVLLTTSGSAGHFLPLVPFARACVGAGHAVRVAAQRSRAAIVERTGLPFVAFDDRPPAQLTVEEWALGVAAAALDDAVGVLEALAVAAGEPRAA
jgi:UDP:flavonoid glycosyltransferase YjiC (YdhE family)